LSLIIRLNETIGVVKFPVTPLTEIGYKWTLEESQFTGEVSHRGRSER
jgi:hypothetical protein